MEESADQPNRFELGAILIEGITTDEIHWYELEKKR
jgi:hypothetical protein